MALVRTPTRVRKLLVLVVVIVVALAAFLWFQAAHEGAAVQPETVSAAQPSRDPTQEPVELASTPELADRTVLEHTSPDAARAPAASAGPRCRIFGRVLDENGVAIGDAGVTLMVRGGRWSDVEAPENVQRRSNAEWVRMTTAADGVFRFEAPVPTADSVSLTITPDPFHALADRDYDSADGHEARLVEGENDLGDFQLAPRGAARGRVLSEDGRPIAGAQINASGAGIGRYSNADADERGEYLIGHLSAGRSSMTVAAQGWISRRDIPVEIRTMETADVPDVVLSPAHRIDGFVVDEQGAGVPAVLVRCTQSNGSRGRARTQPDGAFTLWVEKDEPCALEVRDAKGFEPYASAPEAKVSPGAQVVRIVLRRSALFTFRVVDALTDEPILRFGIRLDPKPVVGQFSSTSEREILIEDHPGGEASVPFTNTWVVVSAPGHAPLETDVVPDAGAQDRQTLALRPGARIRGSLLLDGQPFSKATVQKQREAIDEERTFQYEPGTVGGRIQYDLSVFSGRRRSTQSASDGSFLFEGLAPGTYALLIEAAGVARKRLRGTEVAAEQTLDLGPILLEKGGTIRGVLVAGADDSPEGYEIVLNRKLNVGTFGRRVEIESFDGRFEFEGLEGGTHVLTWSRPNANFSSAAEDVREQSIVLAAGEVREVLVDATRSTPCTVVVRLTRAGQPAAGIGVSVRNRKEGGAWSGWNLGTSSDDGVVSGKVDGDTTFDLVAVTAAWIDLGVIASDVVATPGGRIEHVFEISTGRLELQLPAGLRVPERGRVTLMLVAPGRDTSHLVAVTPGGARRPQVSATWSGNPIDFGELRPGEYEATVHVQRTEGGGAPTSPETAIDLREPYKTTVSVAAGRTATIVVP